MATILSAQCTDQRVNLVTRQLFRKYRTAADYARASQEQLERDIQSTGFYRNKAKNLRACCEVLVEQYSGEVPADMAKLVELPGVGRKTANVVLGTAFGIASGVVVDTHVGRLSYRMGFTESKDPVKIELDLMSLIPQKQWVDFAHHMIYHGRQVCTARSPHCSECPVLRYCPRVGVGG